MRHPATGERTSYRRILELQVRALARRIDRRVDSVRYYALCRSCVAAVEVANSPPVATSPPLYLV